MYVHTLFETFSSKPTIVGASWNYKENNVKMNAHSEMCPFKKMLFENPVPCAIKNMRLRMQPRSVTVDKMTGIFTNHTWQP